MDVSTCLVEVFVKMCWFNFSLFFLLELLKGGMKMPK